MLLRQCLRRKYLIQQHISDPKFNIQFAKSHSEQGGGKLYDPWYPISYHTNLIWLKGSGKINYENLKITAHIGKQNRNVLSSPSLQIHNPQSRGLGLARLIVHTSNIFHCNWWQPWQWHVMSLCSMWWHVTCVTWWQGLSTGVHPPPARHILLHAPPRRQPHRVFPMPGMSSLVSAVTWIWNR